MAGGAILQIKEVHNIGSIHDYPIQKIVCILAVSLKSARISFVVVVIMINSPYYNLSYDN